MNDQTSTTPAVQYTRAYDIAGLFTGEASLLRFTCRLVEDHTFWLPVAEAARTALMIRHDLSKSPIQLVTAFSHGVSVLKDRLVYL